MKIAIIISAVIFIYLAFSTIFHDTALVGNFGNIVGKGNLELFGYLAYINIFIVYYPLVKLYRNPSLAKNLDFYAGWLLFFVSMVVLPALVFDKDGSGVISQQIYSFLLPYIGKAGLWLFWIMILLLSIVLIAGDNLSMDAIKKILPGKGGFSMPSFSFGNLFRKMPSKPFGSSHDDLMMPELGDLDIKTKRRKAPSKKNDANPDRKSEKRSGSMEKNRKNQEASKKTQSAEKKPELSRNESERSSDADAAEDRKEKTAKRKEPAKSGTKESAEGKQVKIVAELEENSKLLAELDKGKTEQPKNFKLPKLDFLQKAPKRTKRVNEAEIDKKSGDLIEKLKLFKINGDVMRTYTGPLVTTFEFKPAPDVKVSKILGLQDDLAMALSAETIRIQAPIPGRDVVGIEIPNESRDIIYLREILESELFQNSKSPLTIALGKDIVGNPFITDIKKLPHLLIAGTTGSGKSVGINAMILSLPQKKQTGRQEQEKEEKALAFHRNSLFLSTYAIMKHNKLSKDKKMKKAMIIFIAAAAFATSSYAWFGSDVIRDMKDSAVSISDSVRDSVETASKDISDSYKDEESEDDENKAKALDKLKAEHAEKLEKLEAKLEAFSKENQKLTAELNEAKKKNESLRNSLKNSEAEKNSYHQYALSLGILFGLSLIALLGLWMANRKKSGRAKE